MKGGGKNKNIMYANIIHAISVNINNLVDRDYDKNKLDQYYDSGPKKECGGAFSNKECYSESTANDIESINNGIRIKNLIKEYIFEINYDDNHDNDDKLLLLMKNILTTRESESVSYFSSKSPNLQVIDTLNQLIKIIVKVMKANYIKKIYENKDNYSKLLQLEIKINSYNNEIKGESRFVDVVSFNDILEFLSILKQKAELKKAELEKTKAEADAPSEEARQPEQQSGARKRRSRKRQIKRRGRKSRKH